MNYSKVQQMIIKDAYKRDRKNEKMNLTWKYSGYGSGYIVTEGHFAVIIPCGYSYIDYETIFEKEDTALAAVMDGLQESSEIIFDTETQAFNGGEWCHVFLNKDDKRIYVNEKILKNYVDSPNITYCGGGEKDPILVFDDGVLIGTIAPVKVAKED